MLEFFITSLIAVLPSLFLSGVGVFTFMRKKKLFWSDFVFPFFLSLIFVLLSYLILNSDLFGFAHTVSPIVWSLGNISWFLVAGVFAYLTLLSVNEEGSLSC